MAWDDWGTSNDSEYSGSWDTDGGSSTDEWSTGYNQGTGWGGYAGWDEQQPLTSYQPEQSFGLESMYGGGNQDYLNLGAGFGRTGLDSWDDFLPQNNYGELGSGSMPQQDFGLGANLGGYGVGGSSNTVDMDISRVLGTNPESGFGGYGRQPEIMPQAGQGFNTSGALSNLGKVGMEGLKGVGGSVLDFLKGTPNTIGGNMGSGGGLGAIMSLLAAREEKKRSANVAGDYAKMAKDPRLDPFGSQREIYQKQLEDTTTNPTDSAYGKALFDKMQQAQLRKDAAAGRRSNTAFGASIMTPEYMKAMTEHDRMLGTLAGANINPAQSQISDFLKAQSAAANTGNAPYYSAGGKMLSNYQGQQDKLAADARQQELLKALLARG